MIIYARCYVILYSILTSTRFSLASSYPIFRPGRTITTFTRYSRIHQVRNKPLMNKISMLFQERKIADTVLSNPDYFVVGIKRNLHQVRLNRLHTLIKNMNTSVVSKVIPELNYIFQPTQLSFTWFDARGEKSAFLLIRNVELGLKLSTAPDAVPQAMMLVPNYSIKDNKNVEPGFCEAVAEIVFKRLAKQAQLALC